MSRPGVFLRAEWRELVMAQYPVPPGLLDPLLPPGVEFDDFQGRRLMSLVGFRFLRTRVLGIPVPFHRNFDEFNLRFYVRRTTATGEVRRGVVFVAEIVPKRLIAWVARRVYEEPYFRAPIWNTNRPGRVDYRFRWAGREHGLAATYSGPPRPMEAASEALFIFEHYWGYTKRSDGTASEYEVEHPRWNYWNADGCGVDIDGAAVYGERFRGLFDGAPASAFVAEGSAVAVRKFGRVKEKKN